MRRFLKDETGAALILEATIIYPVVFLCMFFLIFVGLYFMQNAMLESTAQKMAVLAAKEVAYPGFLEIAYEEDMYGNNITYSNGAIEARKDLRASNVKLSFSTGEEDSRLYRYWSSDPLTGSSKEKIRQLVENNRDISFLIGGSDVVVDVKCSNYVIAQYVTVSITQKVLDIGVLGFFGISAPTLKVSAVAPVNDADEMVRNVDLIMDGVEWLKKKLGIEMSGFRKKIEGALSKIGIEF